MTEAVLDDLRGAFIRGIAPEPEMTVSEWADRYRFLSPMASSEPGIWQTSRTPYLREIMDCLSASSPYKKVVFMAGAQVGKTECGNNWIGYIIHYAPGPALMVQPTVEVAKRFSKQRVAPMIDATPVLRERVSEPRSRDSGNTTFVKEFEGGLLIMTGANSSAGLRSMPIRYLFPDEIDAYPADVDGEGDPLSLAEKRQSTFARSKELVTSTPTIKGLSRIDREWEASDKRRYYVPCPMCGAMDWIRWSNIRWEENKPETASLACESCGSLIPERFKTQMLDRGEWRATAKSPVAGFHLSALYSPLGWKSWEECVAEFLASKDDPFRLRAWVNTVLGETWEERGEAVEPHVLLERAETYGSEVPEGVGILTASVDVQVNRLEVAVKGWGAMEESWLIARATIMGDPGTDQPWLDLDRFLASPFTGKEGRQVYIAATCVDSGGMHTEEVYRYCAARESRRVFAIKGGSSRNAPLVGKHTRANRYHLALFVLGVDTAKDMVYSRLKIATPGPGFMHLPDWTDTEYCEQMCAEKMLTRYVRGRGPVREYIKTRERNEALDLEVYALAALYILGPAVIRTLPERAKVVASKPDATKPESPLRRRRTSSWVNG